MGSRAGSPNKNKQRLLKALQAEYGEDFNPIMEMARNSSRLQIQLDEMYKQDKETLIEQTDVLSRVELSKITSDSWGKIAEYVTPKLKSVEVSMGEGEDGQQQAWTINIVKGD